LILREFARSVSVPQAYVHRRAAYYRYECILLVLLLDDVETQIPSCFLLPSLCFEYLVFFTEFGCKSFFHRLPALALYHHRSESGVVIVSASHYEPNHASLGRTATVSFFVSSWNLLSVFVSTPNNRFCLFLPSASCTIVLARFVGGSSLSSSRSGFLARAIPSVAGSRPSCCVSIADVDACRSCCRSSSPSSSSGVLLGDSAMLDLGFKIY